MDFRLLGTAAGGGVPQWNCACRNCTQARLPGGLVSPRTQLQAAFRGERGWHLINASPDLRVQLERTAELCPSSNSIRNTPIESVILTTAELDQVLGLLLMREFQRIRVYATNTVRAILEANSFFRTFTRIGDHLQWIDINPSHSFVVDGVTIVPILSDDSLPHYARTSQMETAAHAEIGVSLDDGTTRIAYTPALPNITEELLRAYESCDCIFVDGTFWTDEELSSIQSGAPRARDIGHVPLGGDDGTIALLRQLKSPRKVLVHINNTNPVLNESSPEHAHAVAAGWEVARDGWQLTPQSQPLQMTVGS